MYLSKKNISHPSLILLGQCAFTYHTLKNFLDVGVRPMCIVIEDSNADIDPFKNLTIDDNCNWWKEHQFYHYGWKSALSQLCKQNSIVLYRKKNVIDSLPDGDILIVAGYSNKIPLIVNNNFLPWALNIHPSLLPEYRGPQPEAQVILHSEEVSGISIHGMTEKFDHGPIYYQAKYKTLPYYTVADMEKIEAKLAAVGVKQLLSIYPLLDGTLPQSKGTYFSWYDIEKTLFLGNCKDALEATKLFRLRPEGYAFYYKGTRRYFSIVDDCKDYTIIRKYKVKVGNKTLFFDVCVCKDGEKINICKN